jgi:hypothetical protein
MSKVISSLYKSVVRHVVDVIEIVNTQTSLGVGYWAWEARAEEDKLPRTPLLGVDDFQFDENAGLWVFRFNVGWSSYQDSNLHDEVEVLDIIRDYFGEKKKIILRDSTTGVELSQMVVTAFTIAPQAQSMTRNYRAISVELLRTDNVEP